MKRFFTIMLCTVCLFSFAACGSSTEASSDTKVNDTNVTEKVTEEVTTKQAETEKKSEATTVAEKKDNGVDFSKAKSMDLCAIGVANRKNIIAFAEEFGTKQIAKGEQIDFKEIESFNNLDGATKYSIANYWNGEFQQVDDYVATNEIGSGYFKLEPSSISLVLLYVESE